MLQTAWRQRRGDKDACGGLPGCKLWEDVGWVVCARNPLECFEFISVERVKPVRQWSFSLIQANHSDRTGEPISLAHFFRLPGPSLLRLELPCKSSIPPLHNTIHARWHPQSLFS